MGHIILFECRRLLKKGGTWLFFFSFLFLACLTIQRAAYGSGLLARLAGERDGLLKVDSPFMIMALACLLSYPLSLVAAAVAAGLAGRDVRHDHQELYLAMPLRKRQLLAGRFLAGILVCSFISLGLLAGAWLAGQGGGEMGQRFSHPGLQAYLSPLVNLILPNIIVVCALSFTLGTLSRNWLTVFAGVLSLMVCSGISASIFRLSRNHFLSGLIDPFGRQSLNGLLADWTLFERNTRLVPLDGVFVWNRCLWLLIALMMLVFLAKRFQMTVNPAIRDHRRITAGGPGTNRSEIRLYLQALCSGKTFWFILIIGFAWMTVTAWFGIGVQRSLAQSHPETGLLLEAIAFPLFTTVLFLICYMSGRLIWLDRDSRSQELVDALPVSEWRLLFPKMLAILVVLFALVCLTAGLAVVIQLLKGYQNLNVGLLAAELPGRSWWRFSQLTVLAFFLQVLINRRWPAYILFLLLADEGLIILGAEHHLLLFARTPPLTLSEMTGLGPFWPGIIHYNLYWSFFCGLLMVLSLLLWVRGCQTGIGRRLRGLPGRLNLRNGAALGMVLTAWLSMGGYIFHMTVFRNRYESSARLENAQADYESRWRDWSGRPQPKINALSLHVDLFPEKRRVLSQGRMTLHNPGIQPIGDLFIEMPKDPQHCRFTVDRPGKLAGQDTRHRVSLFHLDSPLLPGESCHLIFRIDWQETGFKDQGEQTDLMPNGSFITDAQLMPAIGYDSDNRHELTGSGPRHRHGLPERVSWPDADDPEIRIRNPICRDAGRIDFEAYISTSGDQTALTIGDLIDSRHENGRNHFHYRSRQPIWKYFPILSAAYAVQKTQWQGKEIAVYYHAGHGWNVGLMLQAARESLDCFEQEFGPYQFNHLRIVEFPRHQVYAEGFPGLIPFSEGYEFMARYGDSDRVQGVYRVVAHELAHQWWAHQLLGAQARGLFLLTETLAQHGAAMMVKRHYSPAAELRYAREETDFYFRGRGQSHETETPLNRVIPSGNTVSYQKGYAVMRALSGYIGEGAVNAALRNFLRTWAAKEPVLAGADDLLAFLDKEIPDSRKYLIQDWFKTITIYDCRLDSALLSRPVDGRYRLKVGYEFQKVRSDSIGRESDMVPDDWAVVAVLDEHDRVLHRQWLHINARQGIVELELDEKPVLAVIDPDGWLLDRNPENNRVRVKPD